MFGSSSQVQYQLSGGIEMSLKSFQSAFAMILAACGVLFLASCGSGSSAGPEKTAVVIGKVVEAKAAMKATAMIPLVAGDPIEVHVQSDPDIKTTVGADGSFTLRGLPEGSFTLVFTQGGTVVGTLTFQEVAANQQITISVQLVDSEIVLVDEDRRGIGHAGVELEGPVQNVIILNPAADSRFVIAERSVVARPGVTAIREGVTRKTVEDVTVGKQVHVKGTTVEGSTDVLAYEIKLQNPTTDAGGGGEKKITICHIPPGNPGKAKTLTIGVSAWPAHQAHGDKEGACPA
jgi:hypothetical protein